MDGTIHFLSPAQYLFHTYDVEPLEIRSIQIKIQLDCILQKGGASASTKKRYNRDENIFHGTYVPTLTSMQTGNLRNILLL